MTTTPADRAIGRRCRRGLLPTLLILDDAFDAYLDWRDESDEVWHADKRWNCAPARETRRNFWAYRAALEREEHAARVYRRLVSRLEARGRERAETRPRSPLWPLPS